MENRLGVAPEGGGGEWDGWGFGVSRYKLLHTGWITKGSPVPLTEPHSIFYDKIKWKRI